MDNERKEGIKQKIRKKGEEKGWRMNREREREREKEGGKTQYKGWVNIKGKGIAKYMRMIPTLLL